MDYKYLPEIYGIRWGKYLNNKIEIIFEQMNLNNLEVLKNQIKLNTKNLQYYIYKERIVKIHGYQYCDYTWVECEKEVILLL